MAYTILKDTIQDAYDRGEVLYFIDQTDFDPKKDFPDLAREDERDSVVDLNAGICAGLALHWLSLRHIDRDFSTRIVPLDAEEETPKRRRGRKAAVKTVAFVDAALRQAVVNQIIVQRVANSATMFLSYVDSVMTSQYGIAVNRKAFRRHAGTVSAAFLQDEIRRSGDGLYYIGMRRPDGGHAVTIQHHDGAYRLFDGNSAGYRFASSARLFGFFQAYIEDFGYTRRCTEATWVGKIEPRKAVPSHHDQLEWYKRRSRGFIDAPADRAPASPGFLRQSSRAGRTPAYTGGW